MAGNATQTVIIAFGLLFVILNSLGLGLSLKVGQILADFFRQWKLAAWVLLINFVILSGLIIGFAALVHIPADIKIGYCIVALAAGAPFAPMLTRLAKGSVEMSTTLFLALIVGTLIVVPLALPPTVTAVVPSVPKVPIWHVAWPLLLFILVPLAVGVLVRLRYPDEAAKGERPIQLIAIVALLLYFNVFVASSWSLFRNAWGSGTYLAAIVVPILGIALGSLISRKNVENRRASVITTAQRSISGAIVVTIFDYPQPQANVAVTIINSFGITRLSHFCTVDCTTWARGGALRVRAIRISLVPDRGELPGRTGA
jgi:BASS family bile acid:Na+ symporter